MGMVDRIYSFFIPVIYTSRDALLRLQECVFRAVLSSRIYNALARCVHYCTSASKHSGRHIYTERYDKSLIALEFFSVTFWMARHSDTPCPIRLEPDGRSGRRGRPPGLRLLIDTLQSFGTHRPEDRSDRRYSVGRQAASTVKQPVGYLLRSAPDRPASAAFCPRRKDRVR